MRRHRAFPIGNPGDAAWFVVCTTPTGHFRARDELRAQNFHAHLPIEKAFVRRAGRRHKVERPLFGRYMFVGMVAGQVFERITDTDGVVAILRNEKGPAKVPFDLISDLMMAEARGDFDKTRGCKIVVNIGDPVNIIAGQFQGHTARLMEARGEGKMLLALQGIFAGKLVVDEDMFEALPKWKAA